MTAIDHVFSTAMFHHQSGNLQQAETCCRRVLKKNPSHAECLHLLGVIASESGSQEMAASLITRAIEAAGPKPGYCVSLGIVMGRQGKVSAAASCYRQALRSDPANWKTLTKLGRALATLGDYQQALTALQLAMELSGEAESHYELANQLHAAGRLDQATAHYRAAIQRRPDFPEAHFNLGVTLTMQNKAEEAMAAYSTAILLNPRYPEALNNHGILLHALGRLDEAAERYMQAIRSNSEYLDSYYNLGLARQSQDRFEEALKSYDEVLRRNGQHAEAHNNRGNVLLAMGDPYDALAAYADAIQEDSDHIDAHWNLALANLLVGRFREGWQGYDWRLRRSNSAERNYAQPFWDGSCVGSATILIHAEQGLGDTLQFVRYAQFVRERCGHVILECQPSLVRLLESVGGVDTVVAQGSDLPPFSYHVPLLSLPRIFDTTIDSIPQRVPYVAAPAGLLLHWKDRLPASGALAVGLVSSGNPAHQNDRNRSIPPQELSPLLDVPGTRFFSIQKEQQLPGIEALGPELTDFADSAAAIANLDLVISVDTSVAHLAGAMGRPAWTLLPFAPDWRWMLGRTDSPWYPGMRLFRQTAPKDWKPVIEEVRVALTNLSDSRKERGPVG
jgi:tetratricopeptide (TPR) repeat protein